VSATLLPSCVTLSALALKPLEAHQAIKEPEGRMRFELPADERGSLALADRVGQRGWGSGKNVLEIKTGTEEPGPRTRPNAWHLINR
jgi:hypothetical protein